MAVTGKTARTACSQVSFSAVFLILLATFQSQYVESSGLLTNHQSIRISLSEAFGIDQNVTKISV